MKINWSIRIKRPIFWIAILCAFFSAMDVEPEMFTSWEILWNEIVSLFTNPFRLGCVAISVIGVIIDPTTKGIGDSARALLYTVLGGTEKEQSADESEQTK